MSEERKERLILIEDEGHEIRFIIDMTQTHRSSVVRARTSFMRSGQSQVEILESFFDKVKLEFDLINDITPKVIKRKEGLPFLVFDSRSSGYNPDRIFDFVVDYFEGKSPKKLPKETGLKKGVNLKFLTSVGVGLLLLIGGIGIANRITGRVSGDDIEINESSPETNKAEAKSEAPVDSEEESRKHGNTITGSNEGYVPITGNGLPEVIIDEETGIYTGPKERWGEEGSELDNYDEGDEVNGGDDINSDLPDKFTTEIDDLSSPSVNRDSDNIAHIKSTQNYTGPFKEGPLPWTEQVQGLQLKRAGMGR